MVFDPIRSCHVLFGGQGDEGGPRGMYGDTWIYHDGRWTSWRRWFAVQPSPRCGHAMAFDETAGVTVLFGGITPRDAPLGDTWLFNGSSWKQVEGEGPPPRRYAALGYDPQLHGCVLHGGSQDDNGIVGFGDAWLFRENRWQRLAALATSRNDDHSLLYDRAAKTLVMFGGLQLPRAVLLRVSDGWHKCLLDPALPRHQCSPVVWSDDLDGLIMHGGETGHRGSQFDATWLLQFAVT